VLAVAVLCIAFQLRLPALLPSEADYEQVKAVLEAEAQPGDAVLLFPWWAERARLFAPERVTVVGYQGSDSDALEHHPRIWVLSQPDLPKSNEGAFEAAFSDRRTAIGGERTFGRLHLRLFQNGRYRAPTFSAVDLLPQASVYLEGPDGSRQPCAWDGRSHRCPTGYVAVEWHEVHFQPRRCLRLNPPGGATRLVVELSNVPGADSFELLGGYEWDRGFFHDETHGDAFVRAEVNGMNATTIELPRGLEGLLRRDSSAAVPAGATVRIMSQAQNPHDRDICVEAYGHAGGTL
jgi:hypothetical protein